MSILNFILAMPRPLKRLIVMLCDIMLTTIAFWLPFILRLGYGFSFENISQPYFILFAVCLTFNIFCFIKLGLYKAILRYISTKIIWTVFIGATLATVVFITVSYFMTLSIPRSVMLMYFLLLIVLLAGTRLAFKGIIHDYKHNKNAVLIYGAGESGRQLLEAIKRVNQYNPVAIVDDNEHIQGTAIYGIAVYPPKEIPKLIERFGVSKILLALPSVARSRRSEIIHSLEHYPCEVLSIPGMLDLMEGKVSVNSLKNVSIEDLLGRDPVEPKKDLMTANISGKVVMVTGAGGSIGSELCRQIINQSPSSLILLEQSEYALYKIEKELSAKLKALALPIPIKPILGSVQDKHKMLSIMSCFKVQTIYHAAAYKHVPLVEYNTTSGIENNIFGTLHCAEAAIAAQVETFVLISTDKAVRPTNTMGASKRMAELSLQALAAETGHTTRFCMVRFGNVLGSSGSVIPLFRQQIANGGPLTLTHPEITRYFMTIPEAAQLVIQAGAMGTGGDVFLLDMGESIKIMDMAKRMIRLSGLSIKDTDNPNGDIEIKVTGLRPGEKLYEELLVGDEAQGTQHPRIMKANEITLAMAELKLILNGLEQACCDFDSHKIRSLLIKAPTQFKPSDAICDILQINNP